MIEETNSGSHGEGLAATPVTPGSVIMASSHPRVGHVVSLKILFGVLIALLVLTWVTVAVSWFDLGNLNIVVAIAIACVKATLVALFFMHLFWDKRFNAFVFVSSLLFMSIFIGLSMMDKVEYDPTLDKGDGPRVLELKEAQGTSK